MLCSIIFEKHYMRNRLILLLVLLIIFILSYLLLSNNGGSEGHSNVILERLRDELKLKRAISYSECFNISNTQEPQWEKWYMHPNECTDDVDIVILIKSSIDRNANRRIIRKTWARKVLIEVETLKFSIRPIFLIGVPDNYDHLPINSYLQAENNQYGDIIQINAPDGYIHNTVLRKVLNGFRFVQMFCPKASIVVLSDDDAIIVPWLFFNNLVPVSKMIRYPNDNYFGGLPFFMSLVPRTFGFGSRFKVPFEIYPCLTMPIYLQGFSMVFSMGTLKRMVEETHAYYSTAFSDDIYLSWLAHRLGIEFVEYPTDVFEGYCLLDMDEKAPATQYDRHVKDNHIESVAIIHQCETQQLQNKLWSRLCESSTVNDTTIISLQALYCDDSLFENAFDLD